jgi:uncharacterized protein (DUF2336 family)
VLGAVELVIGRMKWQIMEGEVDHTIIDPTHVAQTCPTLRVAVIGELENAIGRASKQRCNEILMHITDLFVAGSDRFSDEEIDLFDDAMSRLALTVDVPARSMLARRLAPITKAPVKVTHLLANDDEAEVARPILGQSERLDEETLLFAARRKDQQHLLAIARRKSVAQAVAEVLVERGDNEVLRAIADNIDAELSETSFSRLVDHCRDDDVLAASIGARPDIPHQPFQKLLGIVSELVRSKFVATNLPVRVEFSCIEPHFIFMGNGQSLLAA